MNPFKQYKVTPKKHQIAMSIYSLLEQQRRLMIVREVALMTGYTEAQVRDCLSNAHFFDTPKPIKTKKVKSRTSDHYMFETWV